MKKPLPAPGTVRKPPSWANLNRRVQLLGLSLVKSGIRAGTPGNRGRYQIKNGSTVVAGECFDLTLNHVEYFISVREEAKMKLDRSKTIVQKLNENGSASAPTLPSRGSNNSAEETAVNEQHDTTAPALPAMPDFEKAFFDLEEVIYVVQRRVKAVEFIVDGIDGRAALSNPRGAVSVHSDERDALHSTARDAAWAVDDLSRRFDSVTAEVCAVDIAVREAKKAAQDEAEEASVSVVPDPLSTMIHELRALRAREVEIQDRSPVVDADLRPVRDASMVVWRRLAHAAPVARTAAGAYLALEEALLDIDTGQGPLAPSLIRSALAYLGARDAKGLAH